MRASDTPVFTAIDDRVSPDFTVYARRLRDVRFEDFERDDADFDLPLVEVVDAVDDVAGASEDSRFAFTIE
jgi:hypothetical protein